MQHDHHLDQYDDPHDEVGGVEEGEGEEEEERKEQEHRLPLQTWGTNNLLLSWMSRKQDSILYQPKL